MTNERHLQTVEKLIEQITQEANMLQYYKNCSDSRGLTDYELKEQEICKMMLSKASDALRIKFN